MDKGYGQGDPRIAGWADRTYAPEDALLREVRERSTHAGLPDIQVGPFDGRLLELLARSIGARRAVEIGTLGGYSGVCLMRGMQPDGLLHTFELEPGHAEVARESFRRAGFEGRAHVHVGPAMERLTSVEGDGPYDLVFLDADKTGYPDYLEWAARNLRRGGLLLADNAFLFGEVLDEPRGDRAAPIAAMRTFHERLARGDRFRSMVIPTGEGLAFAVRL